MKKKFLGMGRPSASMVVAVAALGVGLAGGASAAGDLITGADIKNGSVTGADIKNGSVRFQDLTPSTRARLLGADGPAVAGPAGATGTKGAAGAQGPAGKDGRDGVRYDRIVGSCDNGYEGEISIADGVARLGVPTQYSWAQIRSYPQDLKVSQIKKLSFTANASDEGQTYLKVRTTGLGSIVFSPNTQAGGEPTGKMVSWNVLNGTSRWNDDPGNDPDFTWEQILEKSGNEHVKSISIVAGCAMGDGGETLVDDLKINGEVIDFE